jgi:hypothetical protein
MRKLVLILLLSFFVAPGVYSQCAMCKRTAETDMQSQRNEKAAKGLNHGILYLLSIPYVIGGVGATAWWINKRKEKHLEE